MEVLIDGIGSAQIPFFPHPLLGRNQFDKFAELVMKNAPPISHVPVERIGFVLGENVNAPQTGIYAVAQSKINETIDASEGNCRLGPLNRKWI
jgi:hypothetical protein